MSVLVTGGAGYIGSHMVLALLERGEEVVVLDDLSSGDSSLVPAGAELVVGDVADRSLVERIAARRGVTDVAHFAAKLVAPESVRDPLGYYLANTVKTRALLQTLVELGIERFIFSSTAAVYGDTSMEPVSEAAAPAPVNPYGRSKLMSEWMVQDTARAHGLRSVILRYFNVAGADPAGRSGQSTPNATNLIKVACQAALGRRSHLAVFGTDYATADGSCVRDFVHVTDLVAAHVLALDHLRRGGESLMVNCGYGRGFSVLGVIEAVKRVSGVDFPVRLTGRRSGDPVSVVAQARHIRETLGWEPAYDDLGTIIEHSLAWERSLAWRGESVAV